MTPVASLSMYDWPETQEALDCLWHSIAEKLHDAGIPAPEELERGNSPSSNWENRALTLGQTCGWPYANRLRGKVLPLGRFVYDIAAKPAGHYQSVYIGRNANHAQFLGSPDVFLTLEKIAINGDDSQSGFHVFNEILGASAQDMIHPEKRLLTGAHRDSIRAVAEGRADVAAIDSVAFELAKRFETDAVGNVEVIGHSKPKPGLPLITSLEHANDIPVMLEAIRISISELAADKLQNLLILDVMPASDGDYDEFLSAD
ncbi:MAG: PhnD/SsuA/transferrin family substrate-binding protein [Pseudomonadota bacterium]